jgi:cysteinyl-tRNA synthetase
MTVGNAPMTLRLYDTLRREKTAFEPRDPNHVRLYVCGPTVYDYAHIGNARPVVVFDVLYRLLKRLYPKVTYVRNITDVDDKIIAAAKASGEPIDDITRRTTDAFHADMRALGALEPDAEPRATEHIGEMQALVTALLQSGHAYEADGHVLFSVQSMADYGRLSRLDRDALIAGARVEVAPYKKDPADFVLWKPSTPEQPGWESPWGRGRPGWHLECSAMSEKLLGPAFDIHGGGQDLIFPHHENEIAQSTCVHGKDSFAKYWMHNGYLMAEGEKMSKSLGNFYTVHDLLEEFHGETIRLNLLKTHYRQPLDFTRARLRQAKAELNRFYTAIRIAEDVEAKNEDVPLEILNALSDDLDTPWALSLMHDITSDLNNATSNAEKSVQKGKLLGAGEILGLIQQSPAEWRKWQPKKMVVEVETPAKSTEFGIVEVSAIDETEIQRLIAERNAARKARNFKRSDEIRDRLLAQGIVLEDSAQGTAWRRK